MRNVTSSDLRSNLLPCFVKVGRSSLAVAVLMGMLGNTGCPEEESPGNADGGGGAPLADYGDAPDGYPTRYAPTGPDVALMGAFPSAYSTTNSRVSGPGAHALDTSRAWLGAAVSPERGVLDADDSDLTHNMTDDDRRDDGFVGIGFDTSFTSWFDVQANSSATGAGTWYLNVLLDHDGSGTWAATPTAPEWIVVNRELELNSNDTVTSRIADAWPVPSRREAWVRIALSDTPIDPSDFGDEGWDGSGSFAAGEIEDHFVLRPVLDSEFDADYDYDYDYRHRSRWVTDNAAALSVIAASVSARAEVLETHETGVEVAVSATDGAATSAADAAYAAAEAHDLAEASASAASEAAGNAAASASSVSSASASSGCAVADAAASASAEASADAAAQAAAFAESSAAAAASAVASASSAASATAQAHAEADAAAEAFASAWALAEASADAIALAWAEAQANASARATAEAEAEAIAIAWADAVALGRWADADADALALALADANANVEVYAEAEAQALALVLVEIEVFVAAEADAHAAAQASALASAHAGAGAAAAASASQSASSSASAAAEATQSADAAAEAAASTDAMAIALSTSACADDTCDTWIEATTEAEAAVLVCTDALAVAQTDLQLCADELAPLSAEVSTLTNQLDACSTDLALLDTEIVLLNDELVDVSDELNVCQADLASCSGPPTGPVTPLNQMFVQASSPIPWTLPASPVHFVVDDASLIDQAFGNPGCCEVYDVTVTCAGEVAAN